MKTRYFSLGSVPVLQTTLFQCPAFRTLCTLIFSSFFHPTQSKLISLRPWSHKVNTLTVGSGKTEKLCRVQIKLGLLFPPPPPPLHPPAPSPPPDQMHIFMFDPRPKEISTKAWLLSHVCYFKMEGSIDRKQRGIPKLRDLLRRQRRESEVIV